MSDEIIPPVLVDGAAFARLRACYDSDTPVEFDTLLSICIGLIETDVPVVVHPGAFDVFAPGVFGPDPVTVPLRDAPGGAVIGRATVDPDGSFVAEVEDPCAGL